MVTGRGSWLQPRTYGFASLRAHRAQALRSRVLPCKLAVECCQPDPTVQTEGESLRARPGEQDGLRGRRILVLAPMCKFNQFARVWIEEQRQSLDDSLLRPVSPLESEQRGDRVVIKTLSNYSAKIPGGDAVG